MKFERCFFLFFLLSFILCSCSGVGLMDTESIESNIKSNDQEASLPRNTKDISTPVPHSELTKEENTFISVTSTSLLGSKTPTPILKKPWTWKTIQLILLLR